jgi:hypothetical protein
MVAAAVCRIGHRSSWAQVRMGMGPVSVKIVPPALNGH